ncbi:MAG: TraR/DksA family transcriptional regulator [Chloroflexi bacterium]|nr:TraR/DksA family transcriptional regulator [Chloroflexota bacterium]
MSRAHRLRQTIRQRLEAQIRQLEAELAHFDAWSIAQLGFGHSLVDDASVAFDQATQLTLRQKTEQRLRQLRQALERLEAGVYGVCEGCGTAINPERLLARLDARLCVSCQRLQERSPLGRLATMQAPA